MTRDDTCAEFTVLNEQACARVKRVRIHTRVARVTCVRCVTMTFCPALPPFGEVMQRSSPWTCTTRSFGLKSRKELTLAASHLATLIGSYQMRETPPHGSMPIFMALICIMSL